MPRRKNIEILRDFLTGSLDRALDYYVIRLDSCRSDFSEDHVHKLRTTIRRFLALINMIYGIAPNDNITKLKKNLKKQIDLFDPLRDTQVQIMTMEKMIYQFPVLYTYYNFLLKKEKEFIVMLKDNIMELEESDVAGMVYFIKLYLKDSFSKLRLGMKNLIDLRNGALDEVVDRVKEVDTGRPETIHRVRLAYKKYRYSEELLQPYTKKGNDFFKLLKSIQTVMGLIQDSTVLESCLDSFISGQSEIPEYAYKPALDHIASERNILLIKFLEIIPEIKDL